MLLKLWCWRRLLRVPWRARRPNQCILKEISPEYSLEGLMLKLQYLGHFLFSSTYVLLSLGEWSYQSCDLKYDPYANGSQISISSSDSLLTFRSCKVQISHRHCHLDDFHVLQIYHGQNAFHPHGFLSKLHHHPPNYSGPKF